MIALASEDGTVTVKELVVSSDSGSFIFDDVINQCITSENRLFVRHSEKSLDRVFYVGRANDDYCAVSGATIYKGSSDQETTLEAEVT